MDVAISQEMPTALEAGKERNLWVLLIWDSATLNVAPAQHDAAP